MVDNCEKLRGAGYTDKLDNSVWISFGLQDEELEWFNRIKEHYCLRTRASVMRMLIAREARRIETQEETWV
jgi:hypothetical protein